MGQMTSSTRTGAQSARYEGSEVPTGKPLAETTTSGGVRRSTDPEVACRFGWPPGTVPGRVAGWGSDARNPADPPGRWASSPSPSDRVWRI